MAIDRGEAVLALNRFGLGPKLGGGPMPDDPRAALLEEVGAGAPPLADAALPSTVKALTQLDEFRTGLQKARQAQADVAAFEARIAALPPAFVGPPAPLIPRNPTNDIFRMEAAARFGAAAQAPLGLAERLVWFWSNHFCVSAAKGQNVRIIAGAFEREAIRPHIFGQFADMLVAVEKHPAMLIYLDNRQSIGPESRAGLRRGRGLNENLGREILELHTLGADGGYSQADVTSLAAAITGWTVIGPNDEDFELGEFFFNPNRHEPGARRILGKTYAQGGLQQGVLALRDIAMHPATARHVAAKLVRHFVADDPPAGLVRRIAERFLETGGDLKEVTIALLSCDEAWSSEPTKLRQPQEFVLAALRATGRSPEAGQVLNMLNGLGQPLWAPAGPNGFPDTADHWASAEGVKTRLDIAFQLARQAPGRQNPSEILDEVLGPRASLETRQAVARAESRPQGLALLLMSPEFQRR